MNNDTMVAGVVPVITWEELIGIRTQCFRMKTGIPGILQRSPEIQLRYIAYKASFDAQKFAEGLFANSSNKLRLNDFPYNLEPGIEHWVLWVKDPRQWQVELTPGLVEFLDQHFGVDQEWIGLVNNPENRTVTSIPHYHIFVRTTNMVQT